MTEQRIPKPDEKNKDRGVVVVWEKHPTCSKCGDDLQLRGLCVEDFPYLHADMRLECLTCGEIFLHGVPKRHDVGLAMHAMDTNPSEAIAYQAKLPSRICRYEEHGPMLMTKIFGDWVFKGELVEYQWKCPECYLTQHEIHHRSFKHAYETDPLTEEEKATIKEKLRKLGYIE